MSGAASAQCEGATFGPWLDGMVQGFAGSGTNVRVRYSPHQSQFSFYTAHYDADLWNMTVYPHNVCSWYPTLGEHGFDSEYSQGFLTWLMWHEAMHTCVSPEDNEVGGNSGTSCLHLGLDSSAHDKACEEAADIKGDDCDESPDGAPDDGGGVDGEGAHDAEETEDAQVAEQDTDGEVEGTNDRVKGLCDFMKSLEDKWNTSGGAEIAADCIANHPLSEKAVGCGISYPELPDTSGPDGEATPTVIPPCGCC